jgi:DNA polymerase-3 subunit beta
MQVTCKQEHLYKAIHAVGRITGKQTTLPILENILMETEKGQLKITATNLELGIVTHVGGKINSPGKIVIPTKIFSEFIGNIPQDAIITLEVKDASIALSSGSHTASIKGFHADDFPLIPQPKNPTLIIELDAQALKESLMRSMVCIAVNNIRVEFTGVNMIIGQNESYFAATDSFRLIECILLKQKIIQKNTEEQESIIIPHKTAAEIVKLIDADTKKIKLTLEEGQLFLELDNGVYLVSRLVNGKFPDYKQIIPKEYVTQAVIDKEECLRAVRLAGLFSDIQSAEVVLCIHPKEKVLEFSTHSSQIGKNTSTLSAKVSGPEQEIVFNPRFIMDALNIIESSQISIQLNSASSPALLSGIDTENKVSEEFKYILMPIKK